MRLFGGFIVAFVQGKENIVFFTCLDCAVS
jgi:hypothetical protein